MASWSASAVFAGGGAVAASTRQKWVTNRATFAAHAVLEVVTPWSAASLAINSVLSVNVEQRYKLDLIRPGQLSQATLNRGDRHIRRNGEDYAQAFANLLPQGAAWPREAGTIPMKVVRGLADVWGTWVDRRSADLLEIETDPRITQELLDDWERNWGLPDNCFLGIGQTLDERRQFLILKMTLKGAQSRAWFIWVAGQLGYQIAITEFAPFMCGISRCGDTRPADDSINRFVGALTGA